MTSRNIVKVVAVALSLILATSALSSVAMAQNEDRANREDAKQLMSEVDRLSEKARALLARAEEQGNDAAIHEIEEALKLIGEAKDFIENGDFGRAKAALSQANNHLNKAERLLNASNTADRDEDVLAKAKRLMERAMKLQSIAKTQGNERALEVLDKAIHTIEEAVSIAEKNVREANAMLNEAARMLNAVEAMLSAAPISPTPVDSDYKENVARKAKMLIERARHLQSIAEEQGNEKALEAIKEVIRMLEEVVNLASEDKIREASALLAEATKMLNRIAAMLTEARPTPERPNPEDLANTLMRIAEELENKAKRIMSIAEEQENREAFAEAETGLKLVEEAKILIEEGNYDDAKNKLREAAEHLSKASGMLHPKEVIRTERKIRFVERGNAVDEASDAFRVNFGIEGNGYAVVKHNDRKGTLYGSEISMHGVALADRDPGIHFVVEDVVITAHALASLTDARESVVTLTSVDAWDGKARHNGVFFVTRGEAQDNEGNTYRVHLRGTLIDVSDQGLVYKIDGRVHHADGNHADQEYLFAHLHYLAIANAVA